ncbi:MAG TPA: hypothetical protein PKY31_16730, partial [Spirochaetota bacterium]|nr:hypothetical protein [Spirochaetota bacterium]
KSVYGAHEHRIFHTYNAFPPAGISFKASWFVEGPNMYYDSLINMMLKYPEPFKDIGNIYRKYREGRAKYDRPLKGYTRFPGEWEKELFLTYNKGTLVSLLLDIEIREMTGGEKSLGDVLRELYAVYGEFKNGIVTDEIIEKTSSTVAGKSMKQFFQKFVYSDAPLNLDRVLKDQDGDKLSYAEEKILGTDPSKADTDGDGVSDYDEYLSGSAVIRKY